MNSHYKVIAYFLLAFSVLFVAALLANLTVVAYAVMVMGLALLALLSIAYMRPKGRTPERHGKVDRVVDDAAP